VRRSPTLLSLTIAASLVCSPLVLPNTAFASAPPEGAAEDPALTEAKGLYKEGEIKFQTADYEEALALWKRAFAILPDGDEHRGIRHALVYNIAEAHSRAYEVSRNPTHLRKAKILLENYRADHRALYGDEPEAVKERAEVDDRIAQLDKKIAESESAGETATPLTEDNGTGTVTPTDPTQPQPQPQQPPPPSKPLTPKQQWDVDIKADPVYGPMWATGNKRIVGGAVLTGIGGVFALASIATFVFTPQDALFPGLYYGAGTVFGVLGLGMLIPGGVLLGTGAAKRREVLNARPRPAAMLAPMLTPTNYGVGFVGRF
jgi:tetratricopeptide (TPR) repeat protein